MRECIGRRTGKRKSRGSGTKESILEYHALPSPYSHSATVGATDACASPPPLLVESAERTPYVGVQVVIHDRGAYLAACDDSGEVKASRSLKDVKA